MTDHLQLYHILQVHFGIESIDNTFVTETIFQNQHYE